MNQQHYRDQQSREFSRFYDRVRRHIDDLALDEKETTRNEEEDEDHLFGKVTRDEFERVIELYDSQQAYPHLQDQPAISDRPFCNYSKLLFSKHGFHHAGSTSFLVQDLGIRDIDRDSYLGGHSSYSVHQNEDLKALLKNQERFQILEKIPYIYQLLEDNKLDEAQFEIDKMIKKDPNNGDALGARAKYLYKKKRYFESVEDYVLALKNNPKDVSIIRKDLAESLFQNGCLNYRSAKYEVALTVFQQSLQHDPDHDGAKLHLGLCKQTIARKQCLPVARQFQHRG